jgi:hypothetical protein
MVTFILAEKQRLSKVSATLPEKNQKLLKNGSVVKLYQLKGKKKKNKQIFVFQS